MLRKLGILVLFIVGCSKGGIGNLAKDGPQKTLSEYISRSFSMKSIEDKPRLVELTAGDVKSALEKLDNGTFKSQFIDAKKQFDGLKIRDERKLDEARYSITYELTYVNTSEASKDRVTNKKHAVFVNEGGKWLISEVRNLKTFIEHQNEMSF